MEATNIKTWEDICEALNIDPIKSLEFADHLPEEDKASVLAFFKLSKLSKSLYAGKQPDWTDEDEYKWWPYFDMNDEDNQSGFGFSFTYYGDWGTTTHVGSRLCYHTKELARHAGTQFIDWYHDLMVLPK